MKMLFSCNYSLTMNLPYIKQWRSHGSQGLEVWGTGGLGRPEPGAV